MTTVMNEFPATMSDDVATLTNHTRYLHDSPDSKHFLGGQLPHSGFAYQMTTLKEVKEAFARLNAKASVYYGVALRTETKYVRPVSSDYDPYVSGSVYLWIAYRNTQGKLSYDYFPLLLLSSSGYPKHDDESRLKQILTTLLDPESKKSLVMWWKTLMTGFKAPTPEAFEEARTEAILAAVEDCRKELTYKLESRLQDGSMARGMEVKVVRGRKVPVGTTGKVFWTGSSKFGKRVGLKDANGTVHWTAIGNVEPVNTVSEADVLAEAKKWYLANLADLFGNPRN